MIDNYLRVVVELMDNQITMSICRELGSNCDHVRGQLDYLGKDSMDITNTLENLWNYVNDSLYVRTIEAEGDVNDTIGLELVDYTNYSKYWR